MARTKKWNAGRTLRYDDGKPLRRQEKDGKNWVELAVLGWYVGKRFDHCDSVVDTSTDSAKPHWFFIFRKSKGRSGNWLLKYLCHLLKLVENCLQYYDIL